MSLAKLERRIASEPIRSEKNKIHSIQFLFLNFKEYFFIISIFFTALILRIWRISIAADYYGDSYHHWLISYLTATNNYQYIDFKPNMMNIVWLPLFHYFNAFFMNVSGIYDLTIPHMINAVAGSLTCIIVYQIVRLTSRKTLAYGAGLFLALQPWFIEINSLGITENVSSLFVITAVYYYLKKKPTFTTIFIVFAMLTRYESWVFALLIFILAIYEKDWKKTEYIGYLFSCFAIVLGWSFWSYVNTFDFITWSKLQGMMIRWDSNFYEGKTGLEINKLSNYAILALNSTYFLFILAFIVGITKKLHRRNITILAFLELIYICLISVQFSLGFMLFHIRHIIYIFPITAILTFQVIDSLIHVHFFSKITNKLIKRIIPLLIIVIIILPFTSHSLFFNPPTYVIEPEMKAGLELRRLYSDGGIICDSPTTIYYSGINPKNVYSSNYIFWYAKTWNITQLRDWFSQYEIRYIVWQNVSYSGTWWLLPKLEPGKTISMDQVTFELKYSSNKQFPLYIFEIILNK